MEESLSLIMYGLTTVGFMPTFFLLLRSIYVSMSKSYLLPLSLLAVAAGLEPAKLSEALQEYPYG